MKKNLLSLAFILSISFGFTQQPSVCVITNSGSTGTACTASQLGPVNPCATVPFIVTNYLPVPSGYAIVA